MTRPHSHDAPLALALRGIDKRYGTVQALERRDVGGSPRDRPRTARRERRGKVDVDAHRVRSRARRRAVRSSSRTSACASRAPPTRSRSGIGMVHQHFTLVPTMTVAENIALGGHGRLDLAAVAKRVEELSALTGFDLDPSARVETLPVGAQQRVEIAKALVRAARILILDEPTAVLAPAESAELLRWVRAYADAGMRRC